MTRILQVRRLLASAMPVEEIQRRLHMTKRQVAAHIERLADDVVDMQHIWDLYCLHTQENIAEVSGLLDRAKAAGAYGEARRCLETRMGIVKSLADFAVQLGALKMHGGELEQTALAHAASGRIAAQHYAELKKLEDADRQAVESAVDITDSPVHTGGQGR